MDDRRDILIALGWRTLLAIPLGVAAWWLFATTRGDLNGGGARFLGLMCAVAAAIVIAPPFAALVALPTGGLFYPRRRPRHEPGYSLAEAKRKRGQYAEAIAAYQRIAEEFPAEVRPYVAMMEIAFVNLRDGRRADAIAKHGFATLRDDASRRHLLQQHRAIKARSVPPLPDTTPAPVAEEEGHTADMQSDTEDDR